MIYYLPMRGYSSTDSSVISPSRDLRESNEDFSLHEVFIRPAPFRRMSRLADIPRLRSDERRLTRRQVLAGAGIAAIGAVAGCSGVGGDDSPEEQEYTTLYQTPVYVADGVELAFPDEVPIVDAPINADLLVLPGNTDVEAEQAVDWLAADRAIALFGDAAEGTWISWVRSDAYSDTFDDQGVADGEPDPQLLVGAAVGLHVPTYRHTWGSEPQERDVLEALDEDLADIEARTPR